MSAADVFAMNYGQARARFLAAAESAGARLEAHVLDARGLDGEELAMHVAHLGPADPTALLAVTSGLHGVEGFLGSALQLELLEGWSTSAASRAGFGLLLVHAVNAFGFSHIDRANERNVDLNRNFVAHPAGHRTNEGYVQLAEAIAPASLDDAADEARLEQLRVFETEHGERAFESALSGGQYSHPEGLFHGGVEHEWSSRRLLEVAHRHCEGVSRVAWIDVHTGLGPKGSLAILSDLPPADPSYRRAARWYGADLESIADGEGLSVVTHGSVDLALLDALSVAGEATMVTAEVGTVTSQETFLALRSRNWLRHRSGLDPDSPRAQRIRETLREAFDPQHDRWRHAALGACHRAVSATLAGLGAQHATIRLPG